MITVYDNIIADELYPSSIVHCCMLQAISFSYMQTDCMYEYLNPPAGFRATVSS